MTTNAPPTFVMPHFGQDDKREAFLQRSIESLFQQTDPWWRLIIVNDGCPNADCKKLIQRLNQEYPEQISEITLSGNFGPGVARNLGVKSAAAAGAPFVMFQDDDDLANPRRVEVTRRIFDEQPDVDFIYSGFIAIDQHDSVLPRESIRLDMLDVLEALENEAVVGDGAWIKIATSTGFIATTSTVAVRTSVSVAVPFPDERISEDSHTWLRMSAAGARFAFAAQIPTRYRMETRGHSDLGCNGRQQSFLRQKVRNDVDGFFKAIALALQRGEIARSEATSIVTAFYRRLAACIERQCDRKLAQVLIRHAEAIAVDERSAHIPLVDLRLALALGEDDVE